MKAQKKPVVIDFFNFQGTTFYSEFDNWIRSFNDNPEDVYFIGYMGELFINTLEGSSYGVDIDNYVIIRGVKGEYYPCQIDMFNETYDVIDFELN